ncbi:MAG: peptidase MA family metallohydrolase [Chloroflexota bacterium]|nr:peptidase MA family metallohydrolase [Chloroflexota bacterium]
MSSRQQPWRIVTAFAFLLLVATACISGNQPLIAATPFPEPPADPTPQFSLETRETNTPDSLTPVVAEASPAGSRGIDVEGEWIENRFPDELQFNLDATSNDGIITRVELVFATRGSQSPTSQPIDLGDPASSVSVSHTWRTKYLSIPPGAPVEYYWEISDNRNNHLTTERSTVYFDDVRYPWQTRSSDRVSVFWFEGDDTFGERMLEIADGALLRLSEELAVPAPEGVRIVIYPDEQSFRSAFPRMYDWIGGRAFNAMGLTVQIIPPTLIDSGWPEAVLAHEVAHLFNHQLLSSPMGAAPRWLDEGLAKYAEPGDHADQHELVALAARQDALLPLPYLTGNFGHNDETAVLAYAQSLSLVEFALSEFGPEVLRTLMSEIQAGTTTDQAFEKAFAMDQQAYFELWKNRTIAHAKGLATPPVTTEEQSD